MFGFHHVNTDECGISAISSDRHHGVIVLCDNGSVETIVIVSDQSLIVR